MPEVRRDGDTWFLKWPQYSVGFGLERLQETRDGLRAELTVESIAPTTAGRLLGPVHLNLLSGESQSRLATKLEKRINGAVGKVDWDSLLTIACAMVSKQYRAPTPTLDLSEVECDTEVEYLLPGIVPIDETTALYGDGGSAKSLTALRFAFSVITGMALPWGTRPTRICPVLYLDWETNPRTVAGRLRRIALGESAAVPHLHYRQCFRGLSDELPHIREEISKKGIGLVIVDSIGFAAHGALVEDETARNAMNALRQLSPATRLVVAHVSAEAARQTTGAARPFGSTFFWNAMRSGLELRRAEEGATDSMDLGLFHRKANDGEQHKPIGLRVTFDGTKGAVAFDQADINDTPDLAARTSVSSRLRTYLLRHGATDTTDLADALDLPVDTVTRTLRRTSAFVRLSSAIGRGKAGSWAVSEAVAE